ncbi:hypothetical protein B0H11DRAFT_1934544 [Mycena galericulata]|nr:hypothetical protein B0H11DRAFT_1934544 [Mycena galericulata]
MPAWRDMLAQNVVLNSEPASPSQSLPRLDTATMVQSKERSDSSPGDALTTPIIDAESLTNLGYSRFLMSGQFNGERAMEGVVQQRKRSSSISHYTIPAKGRLALDNAPAHLSVDGLRLESEIVAERMAKASAFGHSEHRRIAARARTRDR